MFWCIIANSERRTTWKDESILENRLSPRVEISVHNLEHKKLYVLLPELYPSHSPDCTSVPSDVLSPLSKRKHLKSTFTTAAPQEGKRSVWLLKFYSFRYKNRYKKALKSVQIDVKIVKKLSTKTTGVWVHYYVLFNTICYRKKSFLATMDKWSDNFKVFCLLGFLWRCFLFLISRNFYEISSHSVCRKATCYLFFNVATSFNFFVLR